jgi:preprotein translocase subunit YajC
LLLLLLPPLLPMVMMMMMAMMIDRERERWNDEAHELKDDVDDGDG